MTPRAAGMVAAATDALGAGRRSTGVTVLVVSGVLAVLVPVVLAVVLASDGSAVPPLLGVAVGLVLDFLVLVLLLLVVTYRRTSSTLRGLRRSAEQLGARSTRLEASLTRQREVLSRQSGETVKARRSVERSIGNLGNRLQATQNLFTLVAPQGPVPPMTGYVASPDVLLLLVQQLLTVRPGLAVECGSGTSTLFLALAVQQHGLDCRVVSLEHDANFAASTRALLAEHRVGHLVDVRHAPLTPTRLADHEGSWYDPSAYQDLHDIGLAFVDGPPGHVGPQARYPMVPLLADRLAGTCRIVLDDMRRPDEQGVAERWAAQLDGFTYRYLPLNRGAGIFSRDR